MAKGTKTGGRRKGSRNKATQEITELARALVPAAITELRKLLKTAKSESAKAVAIGMVFDRAYGKAPQAIQHSGSVGTYDLSRVTDADLDRLEAILGKAAFAGGDTSGEN